MSQTWAGIQTVTGGQLIYQICYKLPTHNPRTMSTKVKSDHVN